MLECCSEGSVQWDHARVSSQGLWMGSRADPVETLAFGEEKGADTAVSGDLVA